MNRLSVFTLATLMALTANPSFGQESKGRHITVTGEGTVLVDPDRATITVGVESRATDLGAARKQVNDTAAGFLALCKRLRIDERFVNSSAANIRPEYSRDNQDRGRRLTGYFVSRTLTVDLRDLDKMGEILEGAINLGINNVSSPALGLVDSTGPSREALKKATEDARTNAQAIAQTLGVQLGTVRYVNAVEGGRMPRPELTGFAMERMAAADGAETYTPGQIGISASVTAQFAIVDGD